MSAPAISVGSEVSASSEQAASQWKLAAIIVAIMPLFHTICTWDIDGKFTAVTYYARLYSLPVVGLEMLVLSICAISGWNPYKQFENLSGFAKCLITAMFVSIMATSLFQSGNPVLSTLFALRYAMHIALLGGMIHIIQTATDFSLRYWLGAISFGALIYLGVLTAFTFSVSDPAAFSWTEHLPSATNIRQIGNVMALLALVPAAAILSERRKKLLFPIALFSLLIAFVIWSGTRGALAGLIGAIGVGAMIIPARPSWTQWAQLGSATGIALLLSYFAPHPADGFGIGRISSSLGSDDPLSGRWEIWVNTAYAIIDAPLLGHGAGMFREQMVKLHGYPWNHPHNFPLQFLYDWGLLGGGLALLFLLWASICLVMRRRQGTAAFLALTAFLYCGAVAMIEGTFFHPLPIVIMTALMAPLFAQTKLTHKTSLT